jgi:hypothetical protein
MRGLVPAQSEPRLLPAYHQQAISPVHPLPVVFIGISTNETDLIVLAIATESWPSKLMGAQFPDESLQERHVFPSLPTGQNSVARSVLKKASESI